MAGESVRASATSSMKVRSVVCPPVNPRERDRSSTARRARAAPHLRQMKFNPDGIEFFACRHRKAIERLVDLDLKLEFPAHCDAPAAPEWVHRGLSLDRY